METGWRRHFGTFLINFWAALAVLAALKIALACNQVFGTEGYESGWRMAGKVLLVLGKDVAGAGLAAAVIGLVSIGFTLLLRREATWLVAVSAQAVHGFLAGLSFFSQIYVGSPLTKASLDLAVLDQPIAAGGGGPGVMSSFVHYLTPGTIAGWATVTVLGPVLLLLMRKRPAPKPRAMALVGAPLILYAVFSCVMLPRMVNGELLGMRIHTLGLEQSAWADLAWSYAKPLLGPGSSERAGGGPATFRIDLTSSDPEETAANPLAGAVPRRTNVILVSMDSVGQPYLDQVPGRMPLLASLADREGAVYLANHYSVWPQTMKVFFSVFCSELPYPRYPPITQVNPAIPCKSLSETLGDAGYFTAMITSADMAYDRKMRFFRHRSIDLFFDMRNMPGRESVWHDSWGLDERLAVRNILDVARQHQDQGFFIFYEMTTAHHPYNAGREHEENPVGDDFEAYLRALRFIDDRMAELLTGLERLGLADDTLVVLFSDHGEGFGAHPDARSHGPKVYQEVVHVPAVIVGPQLAGLSGRTGFPTSHIDLSPTILGLLGLPIPCTMKGRNLAAPAGGTIVLFGGRPPGAQLGLVDGHWKYIIEESGFDMLFDLAADPGERENVLTSYPEAAGRYRARVEEWVTHSETLIEDYGRILSESGCTP